MTISQALRRLQDLFLAHHGRPAAVAVLLVLLLLNYASELSRSAEARGTVSGKLLTAVTSPFASGRQLLFDGYQRAMPRQRQNQPVTIVEIDEQSLKEIGQWPWPRNRLAQLIDAIAAQQPAAIGLDMYMPEPDQTSPDRVAANLPASEQKLAQALARLPSHEQRLAASLHAAPTVLGAAGFDFASYTTSAGLRTRPMWVSGGDALPYVRNFPQVLASLPQLQAAAQGQALLSVSLDDTVVRRMPLVMSVGEQLVPSLALEMLRVATGEAAIAVQVDSHGISAVRVADLTVPTQAGGDIWLHFERRADSSPREVSAAAVLAGKVAPELLAGRLVLIGLTGTGLSDMRATPLNELVPGIEIQAQALESFFDGRFLLRPWWMKPLELGVLALLGLIMVWLIPQTDSRLARVMTRTSSAASWVVMALNGFFVGVGYLLFQTQGLLFDAASLFIGFSAVLASLVSSALLQIEREHELLAHEEERLRLENARIAGELAAARSIQIASLPLAAQVFAEETRFTLATLLEPAREVGGDLYEFFMLDAQRLFFVIGDVSGKGVPASLFMAVAKVLTKSAARHGSSQDLAGIVAAAAREIEAENAQALFITLVAGIYDAQTGQLQLCNAGHDAPLCRRADGRLEALAAAGGPPLCVLEGFSYPVEQFTLAAGDLLLLFTDGLTESRNGEGDLYGTERLRAVLAAAGGAPEALLATIRADVCRFVGDGEAADDLTLMAIQRTP